MDLRKAIPQYRHKDHVHRVAQYIGNNHERFEVLLHYYLEDTEVSDRAAWILSHCMDQHPELIDPYENKIQEHLRKEGISDAVLRNGLRALAINAKNKSGDRLDGNFVHFCFEILNDPERPVAIRVHAMEFLYWACRLEPDLSHELQETILAHFEYGSAGFKNRGSKILKRLQNTTKG